MTEDGSHVTLGDVARIEIGAESYNIIGRWNREPASGIAIELAPEANALTTIQAVKDRVADFATIIPDSLEIVYPIDDSPFIRASIIDHQDRRGQIDGDPHRSGLRVQLHLARRLGQDLRLAALAA